MNERNAVTLSLIYFGSFRMKDFLIFNSVHSVYIHFVLGSVVGRGVKDVTDTCKILPSRAYLLIKGIRKKIINSPNV